MDYQIIRGIMIRNLPKIVFSFSILFKYHLLVSKGLSKFPKSLNGSRTCPCMYSMSLKRLQLSRQKREAVFSISLLLIWNQDTITRETKRVAIANAFDSLHLVHICKQDAILCASSILCMN